MYSECPKSEHPKTGKRWNLNFWQFEFRHNQFLNVRDLKNHTTAVWKLNIHFLDSIFRFGVLRPSCLKSGRFMSEIQRKSPNRTFCLKTECFFPFLDIMAWISDVQKCLKSEWNCSDFRHCPNTKPSGIGPKVDHPKSECVRISDVDCIIIRMVTGVL